MKFIRDYSVLIKNLLISAEFFYKKIKIILKQVSSLLYVQYKKQ